MNLFGGTFQTLEKSLDFATAKNRTISSNLANIDTPNYKSKDVVFKDLLNDQINRSLVAKRTNEKHIAFNSHLQNSYRVVTKDHLTYNNNGNNVDVDKEMSELAKNQIYYQSLIDRLNGKFHSLETVIRGGR